MFEDAIGEIVISNGEGGKEILAVCCNAGGDNDD